MGIFADNIKEVIEEQNQQNQIEFKKYNFDPATCWNVVKIKDLNKRAMLVQTFGVGESEPLSNFMKISFNFNGTEAKEIYKKEGKEALKEKLRAWFKHEFHHWKQFYQLVKKLNNDYTSVFFFTDSIYEKYGYENCPFEIEARKAERGEETEDIETFINNLIENNQELFDLW